MLKSLGKAMLRRLGKAVLVGWLQGEYSVSGAEIDIILKKKHEAIFTAFRLD